VAHRVLLDFTILLIKVTFLMMTQQNKYSQLTSSVGIISSALVHSIKLLRHLLCRNMKDSRVIFQPWAMSCYDLPSVLWHCWLGDRKGIRPVKSWVMLCWWWRFDWSFARVIDPVKLSPLPPSSLAPVKSRMETFWYRLTRVDLENGR